MNSPSQWLAPSVLAIALGVGGAAMLAPAPVRAQDQQLTRVLVELADVVLRGGQPYYRHGNYAARDRLVVRYDRSGRKVYYRLVPVGGSGFYNASYRRAADHRGARKLKCNKHGKCKLEFYDPRYDRDHGWRDRDWGDDDDRDRYRRGWRGERDDD